VILDRPPILKEKGMNVRILLAVLACFPAAVAEAASFNCAHAFLPAEETVCEDANLGQLDEKTAGMYFLIVGSSRPQPTLDQVKASQKKFVTARNACGTNVDCLVDAYTSQMMYLKNIKGTLGL
jgi:uncharacterized protein